MALKFYFFEQDDPNILENELEQFCEEKDVTKDNIVKIHNHSVVLSFPPLPPDSTYGDKLPRCRTINKVMLVWDDDDDV